MRLDELIILVTNLIGTFIGSSELNGPLLVLDCHSAAACVVLTARHVHAFITLAVVHMVHATVGRIGHQVLTQLESLCGPS